jgi:peptidoglycan/xylan/chitin deacetylase (PgdA/CDA1 family)
MKHSVLLSVFAGLATLALSVTAPRPALSQAGASQSAVVLNYQRFEESRYPRTNTPASQFDAQIEMLGGGRYNVIPLEDVVSTLYDGNLLRNRSVAITIDDAYRSAYEVAWPRLKRAGMPFTLFVSTDAIDAGGPGFMTWDQIRELKAAGVTIGAHGAAHMHASQLTPEEIAADIEKSVQRIEEELGERPVLFSYPHGEMTMVARDIVIAAGFKAAFGQHSGTINVTLDRHMLPRFSINQKYGVRSEFSKRIDTLGLPLRDVTPADPYIGVGQQASLTFTLDESVGRPRKFHCFHSDETEEFVEIALIPTEGRRYELRFPRGFPSGAWRVNCTMPTGGKRYRWWGMQFYTAGE